MQPTPSSAEHRIPSSPSQSRYPGCILMCHTSPQKYHLCKTTRVHALPWPASGCWPSHTTAPPYPIPPRACTRIHRNPLQSSTCGSCTLPCDSTHAHLCVRLLPRQRPVTETAPTIETASVVDTARQSGRCFFKCLKGVPVRSGNTLAALQGNPLVVPGVRLGAHDLARAAAGHGPVPQHLHGHRAPAARRHRPDAPHRLLRAASPQGVPHSVHRRRHRGVVVMPLTHRQTGVDGGRRGEGREAR